MPRDCVTVLLYGSPSPLGQSTRSSPRLVYSWRRLRAIAPTIAHAEKTTILRECYCVLSMDACYTLSYRQRLPTALPKTKVTAHYLSSLIQVCAGTLLNSNFVLHDVHKMKEILLK
jgi:hypothetical protein